MDFKTAKEIVLALKEIAKNIQGDKSSNNSDNNENESNGIYDGILKVTDGQNFIRFSFGIKDNNNATKLGDLFSDNFINDFNNDENIYFVSTAAKLNNEIIRTRGLHLDESYNDGSVGFINNGTSFDINIFDSTGRIKAEYQITSSKPFTKDTPLIKVGSQ